MDPGGDDDVFKINGNPQVFCPGFEQAKSAIFITRHANKGIVHNESFQEVFPEDEDVFFDSGMIAENGNSVYGTSPSVIGMYRHASSRSRNSSVRSTQTVDFSMPYPSVSSPDCIFEDRIKPDSSKNVTDSEPRCLRHSVRLRDEVYQSLVHEALRLYIVFLRDESTEMNLNLLGLRSVIAALLSECSTTRVSNGPSTSRRASRSRSQSDSVVISNEANDDAMHLQEKARDFAATLDREHVRSQAEGIVLESLTYNEFLDIISAIFDDAELSWRRVIVTFFFCADLALRALKCRLMATFHKIIKWSTYFFADNYSRWCQILGGAIS